MIGKGRDRAGCGGAGRSGMCQGSPREELLITGRGSSKQPCWGRKVGGKVNWSNWREPEAERQDLNVNYPKSGGNRINTEPYWA